MRVLQMRLTKSWPVLPAVATMLITVQIATALHYLPITPLSFGLIVLGTLFTTINFVFNIANHVSFRRSGFEGLISIAIIWVIALWMN